MSRNDYPEEASYNARWAILQNYKLAATGRRKAGTPIGWARSRQLANRSTLSERTILRTYAYLSRARPIAGAGRYHTRASIAYNLWGGDAMLEWTRKTLQR